MSVTCEKIIQQARNISELEIQTYCKIACTSNFSTFKNEYVEQLRQIHLVLYLSRTNKRINKPFIDHLIKILTKSDNQKELVKLLSCKILQILSPINYADICIEEIFPDECHLKYTLSVLRCQIFGRDEYWNQLRNYLMRWLSTVGYSIDTRVYSLSFAIHLICLSPDHLNSDQKLIVESQLVEWLHITNLHQNAIYSNDPGKKDSQCTTELDGTPTKKSFTVLCIPPSIATLHMLNVHSFSSLTLWMTHFYDGRNNVNPIDRVEAGYNEEVALDSLTDSMRTSPIYEASYQYALQIVDQCSRKCKLVHDVELQKACLIEVIQIMEGVCFRNNEMIMKSSDLMKNIHKEFSKSLPQIAPFLLQFFISHGASIEYDVDPFFHSYFKSINEFFKDPFLAYDCISFIETNLEFLVVKTKYLQLYFPNILKIFAWNPRTYLLEFSRIITACMTSLTSIEVFHTVLDMPCLTAVLLLLDVYQKDKKNENFKANPGKTKSVDISPKLLSLIKDASFKPILNFIVRADAGSGDTVDKLYKLHNALADMSSHVLVSKCAEAVPSLLNLVIDEIIMEGDQTLVAKLLTALLDRSGQLYDIKDYRKSVLKIMSTAWNDALLKYPSLLIPQFDDIIDFFRSSKNSFSREDVFLYVVWSIGEYLSIEYNGTMNQIVEAFSTLEALSFEVLDTLSNKMNRFSNNLDKDFYFRIIIIIMSCLSKLASRSQDLISRAILCLNKLCLLSNDGVFDGVVNELIKNRASELISLMKQPNIMSAVCNMPHEMKYQRLHDDVTSLPMVMKNVSLILKNT